MPEEKLTRDDWAEIVGSALTEHPEWASTTVEAMQAGILEANNRLRDRIADVSLGLVEALNTKRGQAKRRRDMIVTAIEASTVHPTKWSAEMIAKENGDV